MWQSCVFGDTVKSVPVMEGDSVTLLTDTPLQADEDMKWRFGPNKLLIAEIINGAVSFSTHDVSEGFRDRLKLDNNTGSLTITNIRNKDAGVYELRRKTICKFNISVYARLPVPVISRGFTLNPLSSSSESKCVLVCSVVNVSAVSLSWYKGNSLLSSISVSDLSNSLPLDLDCLDDSYSCVVAYSFTNRTTHLTNTELCQPCPGFSKCEHFNINELCQKYAVHVNGWGSTEAVLRLVVTALMGVAAAAAVVLLVNDIRSTNASVMKTRELS
ncbi:uncharacterized protein LOC130216578 [Danio aesculapii]|uniref:uncharacterized protein LOC130216578 n=1 Tax=Danio aesculapii TaxID=1142201 RepID=UPI0024C03AC5|nr:uncharacterized protein LOC130216578 [Danio aesculapii]